MNIIAAPPRPGQQSNDAAATPSVAPAPAGWSRRLSYAVWHAHLAATMPRLATAINNDAADPRLLSPFGPTLPGPTSRDAA